MHEDTQPAIEQGIYGHEVLYLLQEVGGASTLEVLRQAASETFGPEAVFCNCHGGRFNFDQLMEFFSAKGKVETDGHTVRLGYAQPCGGH